MVTGTRVCAHSSMYAEVSGAAEGGSPKAPRPHLPYADSDALEYTVPWWATLRQHLEHLLPPAWSVAGATST